MLTITDIRYCGSFTTIEKLCKLNEGDSALVMQDTKDHREHLFIVAKLDERQHVVTLDDKLALFNLVFNAEQLATEVTDLGNRFRFYYR